MMKSILFICTANTCRSSMAEVLMRDILNKRGIKNYQVSSAGLSAIPGRAAAENAVIALAEVGLDLKDHVASQVTEDMLLKYDLLLTMTIKHKEAVLAVMPSLKGKIFTLKEYGGSKFEDYDIRDPHGLSLSVYCHCRDEIIIYLSKIVDRLATIEK